MPGHLAHLEPLRPLWILMVGCAEHYRLAMLLAVLHRHAGVVSYDQDVFISIVGGVRVNETGADLAVALAVASSLRNRPLPEGTVISRQQGDEKRQGAIRVYPDGGRWSEAARGKPGQRRSERLHRCRHPPDRPTCRDNASCCKSTSTFLCFSALCMQEWVMSAVETKLVEKIKRLPPEKLAEVENFVDFITSQTPREAAFDRLLAIPPALEGAGMQPMSKEVWWRWYGRCAPSATPDFHKVRTTRPVRLVLDTNVAFSALLWRGVSYRLLTAVRSTPGASIFCSTVLYGIL